MGSVDVFLLHWSDLDFVINAQLHDSEDDANVSYWDIIAIGPEAYPSFGTNPPNDALTSPKQASEVTRIAAECILVWGQSFARDYRVRANGQVFQLSSFGYHSN